MKHTHSEKGFLSIVSILVVVVISFICTAAAYELVRDTGSAGNNLNSSKAFYIAESGIDYAKHAIAKNTGIVCGDSFNNISFSGASGAFNVTSSLDPTSHQCTLTATGGVPDLTNAVGKRTVQAVLTSSGIAASPVMSSGPISLNGNATIVNMNVNANSSDLSGSTIVSGSTVNFNGSVQTTVNGLDPSSTSGSFNTDIAQNDPSLTSGTLFSQFFSQPFATVTAAATPITQQSDLYTVPAGTYYRNGNLTFTSNHTYGSAASPIILIVNGTLDMTGTVNFYGLLYVTGNISINGTVNIYGSIISQTSITKTGGNATITFDPAILNQLNSTNPSTVLHYNDSPLSMKEIIA